MNNSPLIIMAGGKSSRMKRDKALLPFEGYNSLAEYQYKRFQPFFKKVYLSAKNNKFDFPMELIEDCYSDSSPLVALISIFDTLKEVDEVFILSVDSPFVEIEIFKKLLDEAEKSSDIVVAHSPNGVEPLCAIYRRSMLDIAKDMIGRNSHKLQILLEQVNTQKVCFNNKKSFMNLNYPSDYELAKDLFSNI